MSGNKSQFFLSIPWFFSHKFWRWLWTWWYLESSGTKNNM